MLMRHPSTQHNTQPLTAPLKVTSAWALMMCFLTCASAPVWAEPEISQDSIEVSRALAFPERPDFYAPDEPDRALKVYAEQQLGLYLVDPPRRHASERVDYGKEHLHFHLWRPIAERPLLELWSEAASWLVFGRVKFSTGARGLFSDLPALRRVTLSLHEVLRPGEEGRRLSKKPDQVHIYLTVSLTREDFERLDLQELKLCAANVSCSREVRSSFSLVKANSRYLKRRAR